jgi:hypothetical protein
MVEIPNSAVVVDYEMVFGQPAPTTKQERLNLIKHIPKLCLIHEFASLNYRLRNYDEFTYKIDYKTQFDELLYFCGGAELMYNLYESKINKYVNQYGKSGDQIIIFNRPSNLFALQEIILCGSDIPHQGFRMREVWDDILKYYLAVNNVISAYKSENETDYSDFQRLTAGHIFLGTLQVVNDPIYTFERFPKIIKYLRSDYQLGKYFADHFKPYGFDPERYLHHIVEFYINFHTNSKNVPKHLSYYFKLSNENAEAIKFLNILSVNGSLLPQHEFDLTLIKKAPFYKVSENEFILLDLGFLIDKSYTFFINDYYFDYLKPNENIGYDFYASKIGYFFETYVSDILKSSLSKKGILFKTLDELKSSVKGSEIELADLFVREDNKIILGQIKASALNNEQNKGTADKLFIKDKNFFKDFGLEQTFDSLDYLDNFPIEFDNTISDKDILEVYPIIVLNDVLASSIMLPMLFQTELNKILQLRNYQKFKVYPLTLIHIQDLERISSFLRENKVSIWELLHNNFENSLFPKPFNITLNRLNIHEKKVDIQTLDFVKFIELKQDEE